MPPNPQNPKNKSPEEPAWKIELLTKHREWLAHPMTKRFMQALELDRVDILTRAAVNAADHGTAIGNAREHNNLIKAHAHLKIIEKYGNRSTIPDTYERQSPGSV